MIDALELFIVGGYEGLGRRPEAVTAEDTHTPGGTHAEQHHPEPVRGRNHRRRGPRTQRRQEPEVAVRRGGVAELNRS